MQKLQKIAFFGLVFMCAIAVTQASFAVETARGAAARSRGTTTATARMPSIPILPVSATGNISLGKDVIDPDEPTPGPTPPGPTPPGPTPPEPEPVCPDGGVMNSDYTVLDCMNDIQACINGGALPNGINSLYNEELRDSIVNGMGLCLIQVEQCIATVRVNCQNVYESTADVWLDFNARKVQPSYYAFVLRQTGLTPTQAKNTCLLLDRNTFGSSFNAVGQENWVNSEYAQKTGAYNRQQNNSLNKNNPQGATVNSDGWVDAKRGYYARWDAEKAECLVRVAAYNKDELITNEWLGVFGDNRPAEVWQNTGSTFTCNKDLFGFALRNKTKAVAALGIGGGTVIGATVGALAGHGASNDFDCEVRENRDKLLKEIKTNGLIGDLNLYLGTNKFNEDKNENYTNRKLSNTMTTLSKSQCYAILELYTKTQDLAAEYDRCWSYSTDDCIKAFYEEYKATGDVTKFNETEIKKAFATVKKGENAPCSSNKTVNDLVTNECKFHNIYVGTGRLCSGSGKDCVKGETIFNDLLKLNEIFSNLTLLGDGTDGNRWKTALAGAGIGAAAGGAATAITAFVERNNINCRVGDDLDRVGLNKSYTIDRLRDFYVKWALNLPSVPAPTAVVTNCENWALTCSMFTDLDECQSAVFNYRPGNLTTTQNVSNPCKVSGSACIANTKVANGLGLCLENLTTVNNCDQWQYECSKLTNSTACNAAQFYYAPMGTNVSGACAYTLGGGSCKMNSAVAKNYVNMTTCSQLTQANQPAQQ
jgi:hypothetical protein